jgi:pyrroline-5-carboxylate reductase
MNPLQRRLAILGTGNIGSAIARGLVNAHLYRPADITLTRRSDQGLEEFRALGCDTGTDNAEAVRRSDLILLAVTPQQLNGLLGEIRGVVEARKHTIVSVVSGAAIGAIRKELGTEAPIIRAMPNTAIAIRESMTCIAAGDADPEKVADVLKIFDALGRTLHIAEAQMVPATALCACGIAFFLRAIRAASQGGIEIGFHAEDALIMAAQTARGAASLLAQAGTHPESEVDKVTTPQGCTISGLNQMEHHGFSSALIRGIVTSAEKAAVLYSPKGA